MRTRPIFVLPVSTLCLVLLTLSFALATPAHSAVIEVWPDGNGDVPTIQDAIDAAANTGDTILLTDGVFTGDGNRDLDLAGKTIAIMSESQDPTACAIDCQGTPADPHRAILYTGGSGGSVTGIGFRNGWELRGAALRVDPGTILSIDNCIFEANEADFYGGAIYNQTDIITVSNSIFVGNIAPSGAGIDFDDTSLAAARGGSRVVDHCTFYANSAYRWSWSRDQPRDRCRGHQYHHCLQSGWRWDLLLQRGRPDDQLLRRLRKRGG